jgi:hypothetical protein
VKVTVPAEPVVVADGVTVPQARLVPSVTAKLSGSPTTGVAVLVTVTV